MGFIKENKIRCLYCKDILISTDEKPEVECDCGICKISGGSVFEGRIGIEEDKDYKNLTKIDFGNIQVNESTQAPPPVNPMLG